MYFLTYAPHAPCMSTPLMRSFRFCRRRCSQNLASHESSFLLYWKVVACWVKRKRRRQLGGDLAAAPAGDYGEVMRRPCRLSKVVAVDPCRMAFI